MLGTGYFLLFCIVAFLFFLWLYAAEEKRGKRFFLVGLRGFLDRKIDKLNQTIKRWWVYLSRHTLKLSWYYSIHKTLRLILTVLVKAYDSLEVMFMRNKERAQTIKLEKKHMKNAEGHLSQVAEHMVSNALTESEKKKLLKKKLERG